VDNFVDARYLPHLPYRWRTVPPTVVPGGNLAEVPDVRRHSGPPPRRVMIMNIVI